MISGESKPSKSWKRYDFLDDSRNSSHTAALKAVVDRRNILDIGCLLGDSPKS